MVETTINQIGSEHIERAGIMQDHHTLNSMNYMHFQDFLNALGYDGATHNAPAGTKLNGFSGILKGLPTIGSTVSGLPAPRSGADRAVA